jgi:hypothetical protein
MTGNRCKLASASLKGLEHRHVGATLIGVRLSGGRAPRDSLPPCGGGMGWGVVPWGTAVPRGSTPTPDPSPQGGGEETVATSNLNLTLMGATLVVALLADPVRKRGDHKGRPTAGTVGGPSIPSDWLKQATRMMRQAIRVEPT